MEAREIRVPLGNLLTLKGNLKIPAGALSLVIFSHGSGNSRLSPRNRYIAEILNRAKIATLLTDLLTEKEDLVYETRFNIELITARLVKITNYIQQLPDTQNLILGYFGASTGAASALDAAAGLGGVIKAVVSRGGRPDLSKSLTRVKAPTLFIVGSLDRHVLELNKKAFELLRCEKKMEIIRQASHLFEEHGKLEEVSAIAANWFKKHLSQPMPQITF